MIRYVPIIVFTVSERFLCFLYMCFFINYDAHAFLRHLPARACSFSRIISNSQQTKCSMWRLVCKLSFTTCFVAFTPAFLCTENSAILLG